MDNSDYTENPYAAPPIEADLAMSGSPFASDLSQDEQIRKQYLSHEASIRSVGILYYLAAGLCGFGTISMLAFFLLPVMLSNGPKVPGPAEMAIIGVMLVVYVLLTALFFFTGRGLRGLHPWSRIASGIISVLGLLQIPIGTLIHAYILYLLLSRKAKVVFSDEYREIVARTPHIKYKTSLLVKILACILVAILAFGIIAAMLGYSK